MEEEGSHTMVYCKVTAAVCKQCNAVNFLGCREHRELLTRVYAKDEVLL